MRMVVCPRIPNAISIRQHPPPGIAEENLVAHFEFDIRPRGRATALTSADIYLSRSTGACCGFDVGADPPLTGAGAKLGGVESNDRRGGNAMPAFTWFRGTDGPDFEAGRPRRGCFAATPALIKVQLGKEVMCRDRIH
ncbi:hypothetical protein [Amycolatopsis sp. cmx-4-68]|uniref:hypothetical protein n=1 Tax=Amycolatopsis sp. cmx-4-68 TaxID=2790938 RepID=UPI00397AFB99